MLQTMYTVYVPQGCSGRLRNLSLYNGFDSLFVDGFSTCNIVVISNKERISVAHVDALSAVGIADEKEWIGDDYHAVVYYHEGRGEQIRSGLEKYYDSIKFEFKPVADDVSGIKVEFAQNAREPSQHKVSLFKNDKLPDSLLRHPQELKFLNSRQLDQIIFLSRPSYPYPAVVIFSGQTWSYLPKNSITPHCPSLREKRLLETFKPGMSMMRLHRQIVEILQSQKQEYAGSIVFALDFQRIAADTCEAALFYANNFDPNQIFRIETLDVVERFKSIATTPAEDNVMQDLIRACSDPKKCYQGVSEILDNAANSPFVSEMKAQFKINQRLYLHVMMYRKQQEEIAKIKAVINKHYTQGNLSFKRNDTQGAAYEYSAGLRLAWQYLSKEHAYMRTMQECLGRALLKGGQIAEAKKHLLAALKAYIDYAPDHKSHHRLEKLCLEKGFIERNTSGELKIKK